MSDALEWPDDLTIRKYDAAERETILRWDEEQRLVVAWSASTRQLHRLRRLGFAPRRIMRDAKTGQLHGVECTLPLAEFRWGRAIRRPDLAGKPILGFQKPVANDVQSTQLAPDIPRPIPDDSTPSKHAVAAVPIKLDA